MKASCHVSLLFFGIVFTALCQPSFSSSKELYDRMHRASDLIMYPRIGKRFSASSQSHHPSRYPLNLPYHSSMGHLSTSKDVASYPSLDNTRELESIRGMKLHQRPPTLQERFPLFAHLAASNHPLAYASTGHPQHTLSSRDHLSKYLNERMRLPVPRQELVDYDNARDHLSADDDSEELTMKKIKEYFNGTPSTSSYNIGSNSGEITPKLIKHLRLQLRDAANSNEMMKNNWQILKKCSEEDLTGISHLQEALCLLRAANLQN